MKILTIDCAKWRCGSGTSDQTCRLGAGETLLLNQEGSMCCLGQLSLQLKKDLTRFSILGHAAPFRVGNIQYLSAKGENTKLSNDAMKINDDRTTTIREKMTALRKLFKTKKVTLRFINQHVIRD